MKKIVAFILCMILSFIVTFDALAASTVFEGLGKIANSQVTQELFQEVCNMHMDYAKSEEYVSTFGKPTIQTIRCFFDDQYSLFYIQLEYIFSKENSSNSLTKTGTYYFKIKGKYGFDQLDEPKNPITDEDWILINMYSELECYETAKTFFDGQRWKDPSSITIYGYTVTYGVGTYIYLFDYSGKNSFGGNTRETFMIEVDAFTNKVISGNSF